MQYGVYYGSLRVDKVASVRMLLTSFIERENSFLNIIMPDMLNLECVASSVNTIAYKSFVHSCDTIFSGQFCLFAQDGFISVKRV